MVSDSTLWVFLAVKREEEAAVGCSCWVGLQEELLVRGSSGFGRRFGGLGGRGNGSGELEGHVG